MSRKLSFVHIYTTFETLEQTFHLTQACFIIIICAVASVASFVFQLALLKLSHLYTKIRPKRMIQNQICFYHEIPTNQIAAITFRRIW